MTWVLVAVLLGLGLVLGVRYMVAMPGTSFRGALPPLDEDERQLRDRLTRHVEVLAAEIGERHIWRGDTLDRAARHIEESLAASGYQVGSTAYQALHASVRTLFADLPGSTAADEIVLVGAHYDSVVGCPGANDNGTGVAAVLELARLLRGERLARTVRFAAFPNEEPPFYFTRTMGSRVYARECRERGDRIVAMLSLETVGCYSDARRTQHYPFPFGLFYPHTGNFIGFVANLRSRALVRRCVGAFRRHAEFPAEGVAAPGYLPGIFWSDHWSFWREGYRAVMVTDTAPFRYRHYHTPHDTLDKIDFDRTARVVGGLAHVVRDLAGGPR